MRAVMDLLAHIDKCPLGWLHDEVIRHRATTDADILSWLQRLIELRDRVREGAGSGRRFPCTIE